MIASTVKYHICKGVFKWIIMTNTETSHERPLGTVRWRQLPASQPHRHSFPHLRQCPGPSQLCPHLVIPEGTTSTWSPLVKPVAQGWGFQKRPTYVQMGGRRGSLSLACAPPRGRLQHAFRLNFLKSCKPVSSKIFWASSQKRVSRNLKMEAENT